jgi:hypothetical protein
MFFRPEDIHAASIKCACSLPPFCERGHQISDRRGGIDLEDLLISHADDDGFAAIQTDSIDTYLSPREEPAHGQHFHPSLAKPLLLTIYGDFIMGGDIRKRSPRFNVVRIMGKPTAGDRSCGSCVSNQDSGFVDLNIKDLGKLNIMGCPSMLNEML